MIKKAGIVSRKKKLTFEDNHQRREIVVGGYTAKEATMRESIRRSNMLESVKRFIADHPADNELENFLYVFPFVFGCVTPIITIEQFLELPDSLVDELAEAAKELNPHWFVVPDQEKKTSEPLSASSSDLPNS